ncbi:MAG: hypothetical protein P4L43_08065 [Syntrophobacteraceae bacterium]|nr:hypothetical protein [Syntrophobacteraceae bacterium]
MKPLLAILMTMAMAIALAPCAYSAPVVSPGNTNGTVYLANSAGAGYSVTASENTAAGPAGANYACVSAPAYTGYVNVSPVACPANESPLHTPRVMGAVW